MEDVLYRLAVRSDVELATFDAREVDQVVHQMRHVVDVAFDALEERRVRSTMC